MDLHALVHTHRNRVRRTSVLIALALVGTVLYSLTAGRADLSMREIGLVLLNGLGVPVGGEVSQPHRAILLSIRLPRIITGAAVGCGLAVTGAVFQALLMNPLADSYTMGISSGAAFGASIAIYLNIFISAVRLPVTAFAFGGALGTLLLVMAVARVRGHLSPINMVLAGIIVSSILYAAVSFLKSASGEQVGAIVSWLLGSLAARSWRHVLVSVPLVSAGTGLCVFFARDLNILSLGDREARALGLDAEKLRKLFLITCSLVTAACVAVSGIIGFVGLVVPHILRLAVGSDNRVLVPLSALTGSLLLVLADTGARTMLNVEVPVGVLTTLLGGPFFIYVFVKKNRALH